MTFGPSRIIKQITFNIGFLKLELYKYSRNFHIRQIVNLMILFRHFRKIIKVGKIADGRFFKFGYIYYRLIFVDYNHDIHNDVNEYG